MSTILENRASLRAAFYTLMNSSEEDDALSEHYLDANEAANRYIQQGLESAQAHVIEFATDGAMRWLARHGPLTWFDDDLNVGRYIGLPADFLRLSGDETHSPLLDRAGRPWGRLLDGRERNRQRFSRAFYLRNDRLYLVRDAAAPTDAVLEYHSRHQVLDSDDEGQPGGAIDFPIADRWLIVAFAGSHAIIDAWPAGADEMARKVEANLQHWKAELARRQRRSRKPRTIRGPQHLGPNLIMGRRYG